MTIDVKITGSTQLETMAKQAYQEQADSEFPVDAFPATSLDDRSTNRGPNTNANKIIMEDIPITTTSGPVSSGAFRQTGGSTTTTRSASSTSASGGAQYLDIQSKPPPQLREPKEPSAVVPGIVDADRQRGGGTRASSSDNVAYNTSTSAELARARTTDRVTGATVGSGAGPSSGGMSSSSRLGATGVSINAAAVSSTSNNIAKTNSKTDPNSTSSGGFPSAQQQQPEQRSSSAAGHSLAPPPAGGSSSSKSSGIAGSSREAGVSSGAPAAPPPGGAKGAPATATW